MSRSTHVLGNCAAIFQVEPAGVLKKMLDRDSPGPLSLLHAVVVRRPAIFKTNRECGLPRLALGIYASRSSELTGDFAIKNGHKGRAANSSRQRRRLRCCKFTGICKHFQTLSFLKFMETFSRCPARFEHIARTLNYFHNYTCNLETYTISTSIYMCNNKIRKILFFTSKFSTFILLITLPPAYICPFEVL